MAAEKMPPPSLPRPDGPPTPYQINLPDLAHMDIRVNSPGSQLLERGSMLFSAVISTPASPAPSVDTTSSCFGLAPRSLAEKEPLEEETEWRHGEKDGRNSRSTVSPNSTRLPNPASAGRPVNAAALQIKLSAQSSGWSVNLPSSPTPPNSPSATSAPSSTLKSSTSTSAPQYTPRQLAWIMVGLMFAMFPAALDETIIATSMSTIASTFDALALAPWIATAYWMTITAFSPIFGKLSDVFGLRSCLLYSVALFLATSVLCAVSFNMVWLIVFRAISGIAAAGLLTVTLIAISKITTPAERSKFLGYFNLNYCLTCVVGPLLGGVLTERLNWRWCFYINIPLCVAAFIIIYLTLKENPVVVNTPTTTHATEKAGVHSAPPSWLERARKLDYTGTLLILAGVILLVLAIEWGGDATHYGWKSPIVLGLLCGGILLLALFVLVELRWAADPVVNLPILKVRNVAISSITNFVMGWVLYAVIYFVPLYFQIRDGVATDILLQATAEAGPEGGGGASPSGDSSSIGSAAIRAGLYLLPYLLSLNVVAVVSALFIERFGWLRTTNVLGIGLTTLASGLHFLFQYTPISAISGSSSSSSDTTSSAPFAVGHVPLVLILVLGGSGLGLAIQNSFLPAQFQVGTSDLAQTTSLISFFRLLGAVFGISVTGSIMKSVLLARVAQGSPPQALPPAKVDYLLGSLDHIYELAEPAHQRQFVANFLFAISMALFSLIGVAAVAFVASLFYRWCPTKSAEQAEKDGTTSPSNSGELLVLSEKTARVV